MAAMLDDALAAMDATDRAPEEVVVYGRSVGSLFALHVAAHRPVRALVLESGIADVYERIALRLRAAEIGASDEELRQAIDERFDHRAKMRATGCPVLVLHTRNDGMVEKDHAERLAEWAGPRAELVLFAQGNHNSIHAFNGDAIVRRVLGLTL
jgi:pimeloyl-ACP methyl ester carboxylesterase